MIIEALWWLIAIGAALVAIGILLVFVLFIWILVLIARGTDCTAATIGDDEP